MSENPSSKVLRSTRLLRAALSGVLLFAAGVLLPTSGCGSDSGPGADGGTDAGDAGADGGPSWGAKVSIDSTFVGAVDGGDGGSWQANDVVQNSLSDLVAAVDPAGRPAVAYFQTRNDAGTYPLILARELSDGAWTQETVPAALDGGSVTGHYGLALTFDTQGNPLVTYQGGVNGIDKGVKDDRWHNFATGQRMPADAVLAKKSGGTWTKYTLAQLSNSWVTDNNAVDDQGEIVGLWSAIAVDNTGTVHVVQQDVHFGVDQTAADAANLEYNSFTVSGAAATPGSGEMVASNRVGPTCDPKTPPCSSNGKLLVQAAGNYNRMVLAGGQPAVSFVTIPYGASPQQVWFAQRTGAAAWNLQQVSTKTQAFGQPPSLVYSTTAAPTGGPLFAIAYYDALGGDLRLATSATGTAFSDQPIETLGVTGLYPAAAFHGNTLGILYAYCRSPIDSTISCSAATQELRFRSGPADAAVLFGAANYESVSPVMPDGTALVVDGQGRFVAIWRDPAGGLFASRRSP
jgi:hypothetical protein